MPGQNTRTGLERATGLRAAPGSREWLAQALDLTPPPPVPPRLRARTPTQAWGDWFSQKIRDVYASLAEQPLVRATDTVGLSGLDDIAHPEPGQRVMGEGMSVPLSGVGKTLLQGAEKVATKVGATRLASKAGAKAASLPPSRLTQIADEARGARHRAEAVREVSAPSPSEAPAIVDPYAPTPGDPKNIWTASKSGSRAAKIDSGRAIVANENLSSADLKALLGEFAPNDAAKVVKDMPVTHRRGPLGRAVVNTPERGRYQADEPLTRRIADFHNIGVSLPRQVTWGSTTDPELLHAFGGNQEAADLFGQLFAATSANTSVKKNTAEAVSLLHYLLGRNRPVTELITPDILQNLPYQKVTMAPSKARNVNKALLGMPLGGPKVGPFGRFMDGTGDAAPDVHALYGWGSTKSSIGEELPNLRSRFTRAERVPRSGGLKDDELVSRFLRATDDVLRTLDPSKTTARVFGDFWEGVRAHKGQGYQGSYIDILRNKGLLDYGRMLDRKSLEKVLKQGGWSALSIAGLMAALDDEGSQVGTPPPRPPS